MKKIELITSYSQANVKPLGDYLSFLFDQNHKIYVKPHKRNGLFLERSIPKGLCFLYEILGFNIGNSIELLNLRYYDYTINTSIIVSEHDLHNFSFRFFRYFYQERNEYLEEIISWLPQLFKASKSFTIMMYVKKNKLYVPLLQKVDIDEYKINHSKYVNSRLFNLICRSLTDENIFMRKIT